MTTLRMMHRAEVEPDGENVVGGSRSIVVTCSTETLGRDDVVLMSDGIELDLYRANPVWLWQHNPDWPVARAATIDVVDAKLVAHVQFPPEGVSERADEIYGLIRSGVINASSTGFETIAAEPIEPGNPKGGVRITRCELQEMSFVSIPAVPDALVTERALEEVRRMANRTKPAPAVAVDQAVERMKGALVKRGLYEVANLAYLLDQLGYTHSCSQFEADIENDGSGVPAMLGEGLKQIGAALVAMTQEEVDEMLNNINIDVEDDDITDLPEDRAARRTARWRKATARAARPPVKPALPTQTTRTSRPITFHRRMAKLFESELNVTRSA